MLTQYLTSRAPIDWAIVADLGIIVCMVAVLLIAWPRYHASVRRPAVTVTPQDRDARDRQVFTSAKALTTLADRRAPRAGYQEHRS